MKKNYAVFASALIGLALLTGCGNEHAQKSATAETKPTLAVIPKGTTHVYWQSLKSGAEAAGSEFGCNIQWIGPEREGDRERQIQIIEDVISQKVDGVVLAPLDRESLAPSVEKLASLKIPCAIVDSAVASDNYLTYAATDNYLGGVLAARRMGQILNGRGNVLVMKYAPGSASTTDRENGFIETTQKEFPGIKIADSKYGQDTVETALQAAEDILTRNRDVQGFFACNESTAVGTLQALQSQRRTEIKMVGFDASPALLDGLKAGAIDALVVQNPYKMGYEGVKAVAQAIHGKPVEKMIDTGVTLVTQDALEKPDVQALLNIP